MVNASSSIAAGRRIGTASGAATGAGRARTAASACRISASMFSRASALMAHTSGWPRAARAARSSGQRARTSGRSSLVTTTICGRAASAASNARSSRLITSKLPNGSGADPSTRCKSRRVRSMCRRKRSPRPWPALDPSIKPGTSASTSVSKPTSTTPRFGTSVVNG